MSGTVVKPVPASAAEVEAAEGSLGSAVVPTVPFAVLAVNSDATDWEEQLVLAENLDPSVGFITAGSSRGVGVVDRMQAARYSAITNWSENFPFWACGTTSGALVSGVLYMTIIPVFPGQVITQLAKIPSGSPTWGTNNDGDYRMGLFNQTLTGGPLATSASGGHSGIISGTPVVMAMTSPYTVPPDVWWLYECWYIYIGTGGSPVMPTWRELASPVSAQMGQAIFAAAKIACGSSTTGITSGGLPATPAPLAASGIAAYAAAA